LNSTDDIDILDHNLLDSVENMFGDAMIPFICAEEHDVQVIPWPVQSPDLNMIVNVWGYCTFNKIITDTVPV
jgi:hypothetical protein